MTVSGSLVQVNGRQRSFQAAMKRSMAAMRSATVGKLPRRSAWRVMIEKNASTRLSQDPEVGVKCSRTRGCRASQARTAGCLWVDRLSATTCSSRRGIGDGDLLEEGQELLVAMPVGAGLGDLAGGHLEGGEQRGGAVPDVVEAGRLGMPGPHRQGGCGPLERLDLRVLIDAEHHRLLRWM